MKFLRASLLLIACAALFNPNALSADQPSEEESLFLRRIADFWEEGEYQIAKLQMEDFLRQFPNSSYSDTICVALADLYVREKNYATALEFYGKIRAPEMAKKVFLNRMQCLYSMQWYATLADECEVFLAQADPSETELKLKATYLLAISLYQQCLNASKDPEQLKTLASRAKPYFSTLINSELSEDVSQAFAHLCCILDDYKSAAEIYLNLAEKNPDSEQFLFQAALLQSKYDPNKALATFQTIVERGNEFANEAAFNQLVLYFDLGKFEEIIQKKEAALASVPEEKKGVVRLLVGKSLLSMKKYEEATTELIAFLDSTAVNETARPALLHLIEAAHQTNNKNLLEQSISRLRAINPSDPELPRALFTRVELLKRSEKIEEAVQELIHLLSEFPQFADRKQASFELAALASQKENWTLCRAQSLSFVKEYPNDEFTPFAWHFFAAAATKLSGQEKPPETALRKALIEDLNFVIENSALSSEEKDNLSFSIAKTQFEIAQFSEAISRLEKLVVGKQFSNLPNAKLLLALCYRDGQKDESKFQLLAESALKDGQTLIPNEQLHVSLFNSYIAKVDDDPSLIDLAAEHLRIAFEGKAEIQLPNLAWLADYAYSRYEKNPSYAPAALQLLTSFVDRTGLKPEMMRSDTAYLEILFLNLSKLYLHERWFEHAVALLESVTTHYRQYPQVSWTYAKEVYLVLGECYLALGQPANALKAFETVLASSATKKGSAAATATLQCARLRLTSLLKNSPKPTLSEIAPIATLLKDLVLQKSLESEPMHLEAALDYVELQILNEDAPQKSEKRLALLTKMKSDFESQDDLLGKDYHAARVKLADKNKIYLSYIQFIESEILLAQADLLGESGAQKELQAKAKDLLLQLERMTLPQPIAERVQQRLQSLMRSHESTQ